MNELFAIGFAAGLALAIPLGPIGIMMINAAIERGWRHGAAAALGAASVDATYALVTFVVGSAVAVLLASAATALSLFGAAVLLFLGLQILVKNIRLLASNDGAPASSKAGSSPLKTFGIFVAAVAINPPTAIYFLSIAPSVGALAAGATLLGAAVFATGAFVGSVIWGQTLAVIGVGLRGVTTNRVRAYLGILGGLLIVALAFGLAAQAF
jgi:threonine/homoserine/homoserine lactone efflux protein